jgi:hypothetical protein
MTVIIAVIVITALVVGAVMFFLLRSHGAGGE